MKSKIIILLCLLLIVMPILSCCTFGDGNQDDDGKQDTGGDGQKLVIPSAVKDLDGNAIAEDVFTANQLTMVNIWATYCGPCINELAMLQTLDDEVKPRGIRVVGILGDAANMYGSIDANIVAKAKNILAGRGVTYLNIVANAELVNSLDYNAYPTTIFVNGEGEIVGSPVVGAKTKAQYLSFINSLVE